MNTFTRETVIHAYDFYCSDHNRHREIKQIADIREDTLYYDNPNTCCDFANAKMISFMKKNDYKYTIIMHGYFNDGLLNYDRPRYLSDIENEVLMDYLFSATVEFLETIVIPDISLENVSLGVSIIDIAQSVRKDEVIDGTKSYVDNMTCTICMINKKQVCLDCGHMFCIKCSNKLGNKCFICSKPYRTKIEIFD
jgi:hypothetical protein